MKKSLLMMLAVSAFWACNDEQAEELNAVNETATIDLTQGEVAYTEKQGEIVDAYYQGVSIKLEFVDGVYVFNGDMIIPESQLTFVAPPEVSTENGRPESVGRTSGRWANNTVYYSINSSLPNQGRVTNAIAHWEANTSLNFIQRTNQSDYIEFVVGGGCSSYVGRVGGRQPINLASGCSTGNTIHEIGHAIGLYHEHTRGDRDDFVIVNFNNIQSGYENNFQTYIQRGTDGNDYTASLDFNSIMLYSSYAFSRNNQPTITKLDGSTYSTQRSSLSSDDIEGISQMYPGDGGGENPEPPTEPTYNNGQWYTIDGVRVYRYSDLWWYYSNGWRQVENINGTWYYV